MNNKMNHPLITVDGRTLMDRPLEPPNFVVDTLISQGLHILAGSPKVGKFWLALVQSVLVRVILAQFAWDKWPEQPQSIVYLILTVGKIGSPVIVVIFTFNRQFKKVSGKSLES